MVIAPSSSPHWGLSISAGLHKDIKHSPVSCRVRELASGGGALSDRFFTKKKRKSRTVFGSEQQ